MKNNKRRETIISIIKSLVVTRRSKNKENLIKILHLKSLTLMDQFPF